MSGARCAGMHCAGSAVLRRGRCSLPPFSSQQRIPGKPCSRAACAATGVGVSASACSKRGLLAAALALLAAPAHAPAWAAERLPTDAILDILKRDFQAKQYYITGAYSPPQGLPAGRAPKLCRCACSGQITPGVFADDCVFTDPTTRVTGPQAYSRAVASLFDPAVSRADLISAEVRPPALGVPRPPCVSKALLEL